jgi:hypothetical protein
MCYTDPTTQLWYYTPAKTMEAPLLPQCRNSRGELKVGYGVAGVKAFKFSLADGLNADMAFLKLFVSTVYVDMTLPKQSSLFFTVRGGKRTKLPSVDIWDAWTYMVKTERQVTRGW